MLHGHLSLPPPGSLPRHKRTLAEHNDRGTAIYDPLRRYVMAIALNRMPAVNPAITCLNERRSVPSRQLAEPAPDEATLLRMLALASRVPDHGRREIGRAHV